MHKYRTHTCSEITKKNSGDTIKLSGWVHRKRDHGNLLFFDLRDHFGLTQCVIENSNKFFKIVEKIKPESVVCVSGEVVNRSSDTINKDLHTGEIEIKVEKKHIDYIIKRIDRSYEKISQFILTLDKYSLKKGSPFGLKLIKEVLKMI